MYAASDRLMQIRQNHTTWFAMLYEAENRYPTPLIEELLLKSYAVSTIANMSFFQGNLLFFIVENTTQLNSVLILSYCMGFTVNRFAITCFAIYIEHTKLNNPCLKWTSPFLISIIFIQMGITRQKIKFMARQMKLLDNKENYQSAKNNYTANKTSSQQ